MAFSKKLRLQIFIGIDIIFFLIEIVLGYKANSLALVADAFHMLNDVISLCVGLWAVKVATTKPSDNEYTYGFARAEVLGGLVNGVFLIALCLSIFLEAMNRFYDPQPVKQPILVLIVGSIGLAFNILGLFVFHQHDHGDGHDHGKSTEEFAEDTLGTAEEGHAGHPHLAETQSPKLIPVADLDNKRHQSVTFGVETSESSPLIGRRSSSITSPRHSRQRSGSRSYGGIDGLPLHPASLRNQFASIARGGDGNEEDEEYDGYEDEDEDEEPEEENGDTSEVSPLISRGNKKKNSVFKRSHSSPKQDTRSTSTTITHSQHKHAQPRPKPQGGHSHADMNIRGIFLHVLGDALGNVGVIAVALIIWLSNWSGRYYMDPLISLVITAIILYSAIPLCIDTAKPLLQATPSHISIDDIKEDIESLPGVKSCHHLHVWALTPAKLIATLDVELDFDFEGNGAKRYMKLAREIKRCLHEHGVHNSTIQPEFYTEYAVMASGFEVKSDDPNSNGGVDGASAIGKRRNHSSCLLDCDDGGDSSKACCSNPGSGSTTPMDDGEGSGNKNHKK